MARTRDHATEENLFEVLCRGDTISRTHMSQPMNSTSWPDKARLRRIKDNESDIIQQVSSDEENDGGICGQVQVRPQ